MTRTLLPTPNIGQPETGTRFLPQNKPARVAVGHKVWIFPVLGVALAHPAETVNDSDDLPAEDRVFGLGDQVAHVLLEAVQILRAHVVVGAEDRGVAAVRAAPCDWCSFSAS